MEPPGWREAVVPSLSHSVVGVFLVFFLPGDAQRSEAHILGTANQLLSWMDCNYFRRIDSSLFPLPKPGTRPPIHAPRRVRSPDFEPRAARAHAPHYPAVPLPGPRAGAHTHTWAAVRWSSKAVDLLSQHPDVEIHVQKVREIAHSGREAMEQKRCWFQS